MKIDPQASRVTSIFMVLALIVMAALAWSVGREKPQEAPAVSEAASQPAPAPAETTP